jgi:hypothetical protein
MEDVRTRKVGAITSEVRIGQPERASSNIQAFLIKKNMYRMQNNETGSERNL